MQRRETGSSTAVLCLVLVILLATPCLCSAERWTEDAERGLSYVVDGTSQSYPLIQSEVVAEGNGAFHLANPSFQDNWFALDRDLAVEADTKLFFLSRLGWATADGQAARVQVSLDGGQSWPYQVFSQVGDGGPGEGAFSLREADLSSFANQTVQLRFYYDFVGPSAYTDVDPGVGWHIDDIQVAAQFEKLRYSIGNPSAHAQLHRQLRVLDPRGRERAGHPGGAGRATQRLVLAGRSPLAGRPDRWSMG